MYIWVCKSIFAWNSAQYFEAERNKYKKKQTNKQKKPLKNEAIHETGLWGNVVASLFPSHNIYSALLQRIEHCSTRKSTCRLPICIYICMYICTVPSLGLVPRATLFDSASDRGRIGLWERQFAWQPRWPLGCANPCCRSVISRQLGRNGF